MAQDDFYDGGSSRTWAAVPLFPLPNVVLFPRAVLPLHIFEERYKAMTSDALDASGRIAMALFKPGWEKSYYHRPEIEPIVCLGEILTHERLADGKYNFLLQGIARAKIISEQTDKPYRTATLQKISEQPASELELADERARLARALHHGYSGVAGAAQFLQMLSSPMGTPMVTDLIAFHLLEDPTLKQDLLAETNVWQRVRRVAEALEAFKPAMSLGKLQVGEANLN
jgi:Lon protease-like protein